MNAVINNMNEVYQNNQTILLFKYTLKFAYTYTIYIGGYT